ncbi:hypothetical protein Tco_1227352 [Tanacetum coccineum]
MKICDARLQMEEREMYTVEERSRLLAEYFENREENSLQREISSLSGNKPTTRTQLRSLMDDYLSIQDGKGKMIKKMNKKASYMENLMTITEFLELMEVQDISRLLRMVSSLRTMFEANAEDDLWKNQEEWILKSWNFYDNCGVHILVLEDGTEFYMLAEEGIALNKNFEKMLALRLIAEFESKAVFYLLRFIQKQIDESGSHDGSEKDL